MLANDPTLSFPPPPLRPALTDFSSKKEGPGRIRALWVSLVGWSECLEQIGGLDLQDTLILPEAAPAIFEKEIGVRREVVAVF